LNQAIALLERYFISLGLTFALVGVSESLASDLGSPTVTNSDVTGQMFHYNKDLVTDPNTGVPGDPNNAQQNYNALAPSGGFTLGEVKNAIDLVNNRNFILPVHLISQLDHPWMPHIVGALTPAAITVLLDNNISGSYIDINRFGITTPVSSDVPVRSVLTYSNSMCRWNQQVPTVGTRIKVRIINDDGDVGFATIINTTPFRVWQEETGSYICGANWWPPGPIWCPKTGCYGRYFMRLKQIGQMNDPNNMSGVDINIELDPGGDQIWYDDMEADYDTGYVTKNTYTVFGESTATGETFVLLRALGELVHPNSFSPLLGWDPNSGTFDPSAILWGPKEHVRPENPTIG